MQEWCGCLKPQCHYSPSHGNCGSTPISILTGLIWFQHNIVTTPVQVSTYSTYPRSNKIFLIMGNDLSKTYPKQHRHSFQTCSYLISDMGSVIMLLWPYLQEWTQQITTMTHGKVSDSRFLIDYGIWMH